MINLLLDENIPVKLDSFLLAKGWNIKRTATGTTDGEIAEIAKGEKRIIITQDKHFADIREFLPENFFGIVRLRISPPTIPDILSSIEKLFSLFSTEEIAGRLIVLRKDKIQRR